MRFLHLADVAEILNVSASQVYHMVRSGELRGIKIGAKGTWRVLDTDLNAYIERKFQETAEFVANNPLVGRDEIEDEDLLDHADPPPPAPVPKVDKPRSRGTGSKGRGRDESSA